VEREAQSFAAMNPCAQCGAPFVPLVAGQTQCDRCQGLAQPEPGSALQQAEVAGIRLLHELGAGRFSHSWLGEDGRSHAVVVKLLRRYAPDPEAVDRFLSEAERLAQAAELDHPHLARPLAAGVHLVQAFFLVYESGGELTLADELRQRGRVTAARALEFCAQICEGLAAAHRAGVLHLDLKPANVALLRLSDGTEQAVLLDAVTSHLLQHVGLRDGDPLPLSTAAYTAPEVASGLPGDERSDLYSAGVLLFQLLTGRLPVTGATASDLLRAHREQPALRLCDIGRRMHPELEDLLARLMAKDPAQRLESGDEAAVLLRSLAALAEAVPVEDAPAEDEDDPIPVITPRPEGVEPPRMLPSVDPGLESAMLGQVPPAPAERPPGIPAWAAFVMPRWWPVAAAALVTVAIGTALVARERPRPPPQAFAQPAAVALAQPVAPAPDPEPQAVLVEPPAPDPAQAEPPRPNKLAQNAASPWAKNFERAQKALWTNRPASAQTILHDILQKPGLTRRDRARASKLMGDALAKRGNRAAAAQWWRKSFELYDDPEDRAKVARLISGQR
jgi:serine/threonine-protein kinase